MSSRCIWITNLDGTAKIRQPPIAGIVPGTGPSGDEALFYGHGFASFFDSCYHMLALGYGKDPAHYLQLYTPSDKKLELWSGPVFDRMDTLFRGGLRFTTSPGNDAIDVSEAALVYMIERRCVLNFECQLEYVAGILFAVLNENENTTSDRVLVLYRGVIERALVQVQKF